MNWERSSLHSAWSAHISNIAAKQEVGRQVAREAQDGQVIGVGSGSTAFLAIGAIAERVRTENLRVTVICASPEVTLACAAAGLHVTTLLQSRPDWYFDGADEVDPQNNLIKGRGAAMFMEKVLLDSSPRNFILADQSKLVARLGEKFPIPVEVYPTAMRLVEHELLALGATEITLRTGTGKDGPIVTAHGNFILDVRFPAIASTLELDIKSITGVIESGLFLGRNIELLLA